MTTTSPGRNAVLTVLLSQQPPFLPVPAEVPGEPMLTPVPEDELERRRSRRAPRPVGR